MVVVEYDGVFVMALFFENWWFKKGKALASKHAWHRCFPAQSRCMMYVIEADFSTTPDLSQVLIM